MTDAEKFSLIRREALYTGLALVGLIIFWLIAGFGLAGVDVKIFHLPLWAVAGSIGVWLFAICASWILSRKLFRDIDLGGDGDD
ncbi:MAG: YhdT family protein [Selenomonadaceae bacterium]|nr:YhdT family protein [Selenomonadaceae bacterium]